MAVKTIRQTQLTQKSPDLGHELRSPEEHLPAPESEDVYQGRHLTPVVMNSLSEEHGRASVHAYVCEDLRRAQIASFYTWTEAVLGISSHNLLARAQKLAELKWFEDEVVQEALVDYARAKIETDRYDPFVHLSNRVLELARGSLPGVSKMDPINNFCFANNATKVVDPTPSHGALAAKCRPDILGLSTPKGRKLYKPGGSVGWPDILMWGELKFWTVLIATLNDQRMSRGLSPLDEAGIPEDGPLGQVPVEREGLFAKKSNTTARRRKAKSTQATPHSGGTKTEEDRPSVKVGRKRFAQEDLLANIDKSSSAKRRHSTGPSAEIHDNASTAIQSSSYALELLSGTQGTRVHCFGFVLKDDRLSLWYYDASGVVYTQEFISIIDDFEVFAALMIQFAGCTAEQFGVMPLSVLKVRRSAANRLPVDLGKRTLTMTHPRSKQEVLVSLDKPISAQHSLVGRRTFLYTVKTKPGDTNKPLIVKFSYQVCTREAEQDLVGVARRAGVKHLPRIHMWAELWKLSDGVRQMFYHKSKGAVAFENRTLRAIVYTQYASIKELFSQSPTLIPVMVVQMVDCLHDLRYKANMLHRDISVNNLMYQLRNGRHHFILIDFDMAIVVPAATEGSLAASSRHCTGTLPFMAYELVRNASGSHKRNWKPIPHQLRHDYESLFWVALWCVLTLLLKGLSEERQKELTAHALSLEQGQLKLIASAKLDLCTCPLADSDIVLPKAARSLRRWFAVWGKLLLEVTDVLRRFRFKTRAAIDDDIPCDDENSEKDAIEDEENEDVESYTLDPEWQTAGGLFTRDNLKAILLPAFQIPVELEEPAESDGSDAEENDTDHPGNLADSGLEEAIPEETVNLEVTHSTLVRTRRIKPAGSGTSQPVENDIRSRLRPRRPRA